MRRVPVSASAFVESSRSALGSLAAHGLRTALTTLGVVIGVASIVAVVTLLDGLRDAIADQFAGLGGKSLAISALTPVEDALQGRRARLTPEDLELVQTRVEGVSNVTPLVVIHDEVHYGGRSTVVQVRGTTHSYQDVYNSFPARGRFLSPADGRQRRRVFVIGEEARESLGMGEDPTGRFIGLAGEWCRVVGVMERKGQLLGANPDNHVLLPYETMRAMAGPHEPPELLIHLTVLDPSLRLATAERIRALLRRARDLDPEDQDDFRVQTAEEVAEAFDAVAATITAFVAGMVGISLLVAGVGVMNVMLVSVTERTREIGICKALGATRQHVLLQFLIEAATLSSLGGMIGLLVGAGIATFVASLIPDFPTPLPPTSAVVLALVFSALVGIVFGVLPALRAANMDPIEALRHE